MATARDVMDEPEFIDAEASVEEVVERVKGIENTLMVKEDGDFIGEIHERSLLKVLIPDKRLDEERVIGILGFSFDTKYVAETAEDLVNRHEMTVDPDEEIGEIAFIMDREDVTAIPVEENDEIVGVVHQNRLVEEI